jgi:hypothetical protein
MIQTDKMNREKACSILDLPFYFNKAMLRKKYKIACLKYHPDKNPNHHDENYNDLFVEIKNAYDFLKKELNESNESRESRESNELNKESILNHFDSDTLKYYVSILHFFKENIDRVINPVVDHLKKFEYYELYPTLDQLFNKSLYILNDIYIPLWHHELTIDHYKIKIIPDLPDYIDIDMNNNVHVYLTVEIRKLFTFLLGGVSFLITDIGDQLFIGKGIPIIQEKIYDISLSDVIFHITLNS